MRADRGADARPKLVHVSTSDMSIGVLLLNQLRAFRESGYEVVAICSDGPHLARVREEGMRVLIVPMIRAITPVADLVAAYRLFRAFRRERPDIVHTHTPKAALLAQYAAWAARVPIRIHTIHGLYLPGHMTSRTRPLFLWLERITMWPAHLCLSQNPEDIPVAVEERVCEAERLELLGNGIDLSRFDPARVNHRRVEELRESWGLRDARVVGIVGRVNVEKGYLEFFEAARRVAEKDPSARFLIVGPVETEKSNALDPEMLTREFGLEGRVVVAGLREEMPEIYSLMDMLVLPSHREGFPRSPMEASTLGIPVIATDIRGCRQVVVPGRTRFLTPLRDASALADRILDLLSDEDLRRRMGAAAREHALHTFDERSIIERTLGAYDRLLVGRAA